MDAGDYLEAIGRESDALSQAARESLHAPVPSCPEWTVRDLVEHMGFVDRAWTERVARRLQDRASLDLGDAPQDGLVDWFDEGARRLQKVLSNADPSERVWTWSHQKNVAFVQRRMAQETTVHRWDCQAAVGSPEPIKPALAADGVDEFLDIIAPATWQRSEQPRKGGGQLIHMHQTDGDGEWLLRLAVDGLQIERGHAKGDAAVRGTASDLLLLLWRRKTPSELEVFGDGTMLERFLSWADLT
jgi:uncharacterized protein (TIGR03083 family)